MIQDYYSGIGPERRCAAGRRCQTRHGGAHMMDERVMVGAILGHAGRTLVMDLAGG